MYNQKSPKASQEDSQKLLSQSWPLPFSLSEEVKVGPPAAILCHEATLRTKRRDAVN